MLKQIATWAARHARPLRNRTKSPFAHQVPPLIIHGTYHKMGTIWFKRVLEAVSKFYGLNFYSESASQLPMGPPPGTDIFMRGNSQFDFSSFENYVGSHMIRDPRDVIVSGYYYHLWTREPWANRPIGNDMGSLPLDSAQRQMTYKDLLRTCFEIA